LAEFIQSIIECKRILETVNDFRIQGIVVVGRGLFQPGMQLSWNSQFEF